jgi:hypothetical protein
MSEEQDDLQLALDVPLTKDKMLEIIGMNMSTHPANNMSLAAKRRLRATIFNLRTGIQAVTPAVCTGPVKCPFAHKCPIVDRDIRDSHTREVDMIHQDADDFPIGDECIVEKAILNVKRRDYIEEYEVDPTSPTEIGMANKLAELDLLEMRVSLVLSGGDDNGEGVNLLKKQITGLDRDNNPISRLEIHPAWELKERIQKQRDSILLSMIGTRREQYKRDAAMKERIINDPSSKVSELKAAIIQNRNKGEEDIIDAEFTEE